MDRGVIMKEFLKNLDKKTKGMKRHAGAVIVVVPTLLKLFGVDDETSKNVLTIIQAAGTIIWGAGWIDAAVRK